MYVYLSLLRPFWIILTCFFSIISVYLYLFQSVPFYLFNELDRCVIFFNVKTLNSSFQLNFATLTDWYKTIIRSPESQFARRMHKKRKVALQLKENHRLFYCVAMPALMLKIRHNKPPWKLYRIFFFHARHILPIYHFLSITWVASFNILWLVLRSSKYQNIFKELSKTRIDSDFGVILQ